MLDIGDWSEFRRSGHNLGQRYSGLPVAIGERQQVLRIRRLGDQIEVARIPAPAV